MAKYQEFKTKTFDLKKDAVQWAKKIKKQNEGGGATIKIETNYDVKLSKWEARVYRRLE